MSTLEHSWRARYERWATQHELEHQIAGWSEQGLTRRLDLVLHAIEQTAVPSGSKFLDLGSGPGTYTRILARRGYECIGLDYSHNVTKRAKEKHTTGRYLQGEAYHLPFRDRSFDALLCVGVLQSLTAAKTAIAEIRRVLKPKGHLFLDGLNSLFWLHVVRSGHQRLTHADKRMSYYSPFRLVNEMRNMGFTETQIYWLAAPASIESWFPFEALKTRGASAIFGYAFLISARNGGS